MNHDGLTLYDSYIEAGLRKSFWTYENGAGPYDDRPEFFIAWEDYPNTFGQEEVPFGRVAVGAWHTVKIANFQPSHGGPSDWCVYLNGVLKYDVAANTEPFWFYEGKPITSSERALLLDANNSSFNNIRNRFADNTQPLWTSMRYQDNDPGWRPFSVSGSAWRCVSDQEGQNEITVCSRSTPVHHGRWRNPIHALRVRVVGRVRNKRGWRRC